MTKYAETLINEAIGFEDELYGWSNSKTIYYPLSFKANDNIYSAHIELKKPNSITIIFEGEKITEFGIQTFQGHYKNQVKKGCLQNLQVPISHPIL